MRQKLLKKFGHLLGKPVRMANFEPDRMITKLLHMESDGVLCVETDNMLALSFDGEWKREKYMPDAIPEGGPCNRPKKASR